MILKTTICIRAYRRRFCYIFGEVESYAQIRVKKIGVSKASL